MCGRAFNASRIEHHGNARIVEGCVLVGCKVVAPIFGFRDQFAGDKIIHFLVLWREREEGGYGSVCRIIRCCCLGQDGRVSIDSRVDASLIMLLLC